MTGDAAGRRAVPLAPGPGPRPGLVNPANAVTLLRLVLVPVFAVLLGPARLAAFAVFAVAAATDRLDGQLARRQGWVTEFGKIADPIADKALTGTAFVGVSVLGELPWWVTAVVLGREAGVTALRLVMLRHGVIAASRGGKAKTVVQGVALALYILPLSGWPTTVRAALMAVAVVVTVATGLDYVRRATRLRASARDR